MENLDITSSHMARHFSSFVQEFSGESRFVTIVSGLLSTAVAAGDICLSLTDLAEMTHVVDGEAVTFPAGPELCADLLRSVAVGRPGEVKPLIIDDGGRLYLYRYWKYEQEIACFLENRGSAGVPVNDAEALADSLRKLFPPQGEGIDWQMMAALAALTGQVTIVSGGPGTGKTSTVVKILGLLLEGDLSLKIALAAPTGKAAARLKESIRSAREKLPCTEEVRGAIPEEVSTIHRLLGYVPGSVRFRLGTDNRLPHDVVVVDEASMVSLPLFAKLVAALRPKARLILLGDRDQLASVEAGAVLGDIAGPFAEPPFTSVFADMVAKVAGDYVPIEESPAFPLADRVILLRKSYRFRGDSGIAAACAAINSGDGASVIDAFRRGTWSDLSWQDLPPVERLQDELRPLVIAGCRDYLQAGSPEEALRRFDRFRVLCAVRNGPYGVEGINAVVTKILSGEGLIHHEERWYAGRPVMITANDYSLRLFNGDIGLVLTDPEDGHQRVFFPGSDGGIRKFAPLQLPRHETAFAMTVHKSQGSEFERVLFVLPDKDVQILTRELLYTGISRAKMSAVVLGAEEFFIAGVARKIARQGGLGSLLWG